MVAPATITVYDTIYDTAGNAVSGVTVTCVLNSSQETTSGGLIGPRQQSTQTVAGRFAFTVVCNDLLSPSGSTYTISTPFRSYDIAPQSANGASQQTTAANVIVSVPTALQTIPSLSGTYSGPADLAIRSLTLLSSSPYAPLPGLPAGALAGAVEDFGGANGQVYNVKHPTYGTVGSTSIDQTAHMQVAVTAIKNAGRGILLIPPDAYLIGTGNVPLDFTGCTNMMIYAVGAKLQLPASGAGTMYAFQFNGTTSNLFIYGVELYSPYASAPWSLVLMGSGTMTNVSFIRCWLHGDLTGGASQPYVVNMTPTANAGISDLLFDYCRFESPGTGSVQVSGLLIRGFNGLKVQNCTFVNINNPIVPDNVYQKQALIYTGNFEWYSNGTNPCEGPDMWGINGITYVNNTQNLTFTPSGSGDYGGALIDTGVGLNCTDVVIVGNNFEWNPDQFSPRAAAGSTINWVTMKGNTLNCGRTSSPTGCIVLYADPNSASGHFTIEGNTCHGTFGGLPIQVGSGYTDLNIKNNPGADTAVAQTNTVATAEVKAVTAYGDLATVGPSVTVVVGASGIVRVTLTAKMWVDNAGNTAFMSFVGSGANSPAAVDTQALQVTSSVAGHVDQSTVMYILTGLTAGSTTFKAQYRCSAVANANFANRVITAECL